MKELTGLLVKIGHVGEIARLLSVFSKSQRDPIGRRELIELVSKTAGAGHRYPNPIPAIDLAVSLGLIQKKSNIVSLTETGRSFLVSPSQNLLDLSEPQAQMLIALLLDHDTFRDNVSILLSQFRQRSGSRLEITPTSLKLSESVTVILKILQQLGVVEYQKELLILNPALELVLPEKLVETSAGLTEEALWKRIENQRMRGRIAEETVVVEEKKRLIQLGRSDLADLVLRVSAINTSAGYDVESFEEDGSPRYIEVKSSTGYQVRFEWSAGERKRAEKLKNRYWIYFVSMSYALPNLLMPIQMIQDPIAHIEAKELIETPSNYTVFERKRFYPTEDFRVSTVGVRLVNWPSS